MRVIDADEAKEKMKDMAAYSTHGCLLYLSDALHKIDECQTLNISGKETAWIPVTERLPNAKERVLVSIFRPDFDTPVFTSIDHLKPNGEEWFLNSKSDVTAWMPLPEPYEGEDAK